MNETFLYKTVLNPTIYTEKTFPDALTCDLRYNTRRFVKFVSVFAKDHGIERFTPLLAEAKGRGIEVCVILQEPIGWRERHSNPEIKQESMRLQRYIEALQEIPVHVVMKPFIHVKIVIIDGHIQYFGTFNLLSNNPRFSLERMERTDSAKAALATTQYYNLEDCAECIGGLKPHDPILLEASSIGARIAERRRGLGLSQRELAKLAGMSRTQLNRVETGESIPQVDTYITLCKQLRSDLILVPDESTKLLEEFIPTLPPIRTARS